MEGAALKERIHPPFRCLGTRCGRCPRYVSWRQVIPDCNNYVQFTPLVVGFDVVEYAKKGEVLRSGYRLGCGCNLSN